MGSKQAAEDRRRTLARRAFSPAWLRFLDMCSGVQPGCLELELPDGRRLRGTLKAYTPEGITFQAASMTEIFACNQVHMLRPQELPDGPVLRAPRQLALQFE